MSIRQEKKLPRLGDLRMTLSYETAHTREPDCPLIILLTTSQYQLQLPQQ
jgi:hypothetical protein